MLSRRFGQVPINVDEMNIDMLSSSGHKLNGPKGIGFLYIRKGVKIRSFVHGGAQERKRRAGTENVPGIVGLGKAVELAMASMDQRMKQETELRDYAISRIEKEIPYCRLNGDRVKRLPNNINFSFQFVEGESLLIMLDMKESVHPVVQLVHQALWIHPMSFLQSDCRMRSHMVPFV